MYVDKQIGARSILFPHKFSFIAFKVLKYRLRVANNVRLLFARYNLSMNLDGLGNRLKTSFPDAEIILPIKKLGEGYASEVVESNNGIVFKIAKNHIVQKTYKREHTLLHLLELPPIK